MQHPAERRHRKLIYLAAAAVAMLAALILSRSAWKLLSEPDPPVDRCYEYAFHTLSPRHGETIILQQGFYPGERGLQLMPSSAGRIVFAFEKQPHQGCLLRAWFYGDTGGRGRPNSISISSDGGVTFHTIAANTNSIGAVFDVSDRLAGINGFQIAFEAENHEPFPATVLGGVEVVIGSGPQLKPRLPSLPGVPVVLCLLLVITIGFFLAGGSREEKVVMIAMLLILILGTYLRWQELVRIAGTVLDEDARGYYAYAQKMDLFSEHGFYSAHFEKREPLFILVVKMFFALSGASVTHLRLVSLLFSVLVIYVSYRIGKEWFHPLAGLAAAFILAVHPYLIQLSARGLREEWCTVLLLLLIYYGYVKARMWSPLTIGATGVLSGCILLTRAEFLPLIVLLLLLYPLAARKRWNYPMALMVLLTAAVLFLPQQLSMYKRYGDPFFTANQYARFYANREFAGQPGFPSREEIAEKGMYYGPRITPLQFYFTLHTPWQVISASLLGFVKIHLKMPLAFIAGRGNAAEVRYRAERLRHEPRRADIEGLLKLGANLLRERWWAVAMGCAVMITLLRGLVIAGQVRCFMVYAFLLLFQMHTSFLAYLGLDERLTVHSYPLIALCCGLCLCSLTRAGAAAIVQSPVRC